MGFRVPSQGCGFRLRFDNFDPFVRTLEPGDALVHHCQTIHYSSPNKTDHPCCGLLRPAAACCWATAALLIIGRSQSDLLDVLAHLLRRALSRAACTAGSSRPTSVPMMAITASSSTSVKPRRRSLWLLYVRFIVSSNSRTPARSDRRRSVWRPAQKTCQKIEPQEPA